MRLRRASEYRRSRWKNGKGETLEIAVHPPSATLDNFDWRISVALLEGDAQFSAFVGIERTLAIISGAGVVLHLGYDLHQLDQLASPLRFSGDRPARAKLIDGPGADLNVMTRTGVVDHDVERVPAGSSLRGAAELTGLFAQSEVQLLVADVPTSLTPWDFLELADGETGTVMSGEALIVQIRRAPQPSS